MASSVNYKAGGNIRPSVFTMAYGPAAYCVVQADGTQPILGISQEGVQNSPGTAADTGFAAASGMWLNIYQDEDHDEPLLYIGDTVTGGTLLKSDANGFGIPVVLTGSTVQYVGAEARTGGVSGDLIRVRPRFDIVH